MSDFTKGKLETDQSCCNCIDILSKEDGSIVAQIMECEDDELSITQRANAEELVCRWNEYSTLKQQRDDLLEACKKARKLLSEVIIPMGAKKQDTPIYNTIKELEAAIANCEP